MKSPHMRTRWLLSAVVREDLVSAPCFGLWDGLDLILTCVCRPSPAGSTAPTVTRPTVFPRMEPSSCTRSSAVHWTTLSWCCGHLGPGARATPSAPTASAIHLSGTWRKVGLNLNVKTSKSLLCNLNKDRMQWFPKTSWFILNWIQYKDKIFND